MKGNLSCLAPVNRQLRIDQPRTNADLTLFLVENVNVDRNLGRILDGIKGR